MKKYLSRHDFSKTDLLVFVLVFACIGGFILLKSDATGFTANVFVAANGSDSGTNCKRFATPQVNPDPGGASLCASFDKAYALSSCGDTIEVEAGSFTDQSISSASKACAANSLISFTPNTGTAIIGGNLSIDKAGYIKLNATNISGTLTVISSMSSTVCGAAGTSQYVVADNISAGRFAVTGPVSNITISNSSLGPEVNQAATIAPYNRGVNWYAPCSVNIVHNTFHDYTVDSSCQAGDSSCLVHDECLHLYSSGATYAGMNINIERNNFASCPSGARGVSGGLLLEGFFDGVKVINNMFGSGSNVGIGISYDNRNIDIEYNSGRNMSYEDTYNDCSSLPCGPFTIRGNYMTIGYGTCDNHVSPGAAASGATVTYSHNVWKSDGGGGTTLCADNDGDILVPSLDWVNVPIDLHLIATANAINKGDPVNCPATDIDGDSRPQGGVCDAGADEYVAPPNTANLWVDSNGGSCARQAVAGPYEDAQACGSLDAAFAASQSGDLVLIKCATYPAQTINAVKTSGNVTFQSEVGKCAVFEANGSTAIGLGNKVGYLTLNSLTVNGRIVGSSSTGTGNNDVTISNNDIDVGKKVNGPPINYYVGSNLVISHNTIGPSCCGYNGGSGFSPEGIRIGKPSTEAATCQTQACNVTIADNLIQYTVRDCQFWPTSGFGTCPDTTCTNAVGCHMDGIHVWGMDGGTITRNRLYGVECQGIYFENTNNSLQRNIDITNNAISSVTGGCSNKGVYFSAGGSTNNTNTGFAGTWNIAFNSGSSYIMGPGGCSSCQTGTVFNIVGNNMELDVVNSSGNNAGCGAAVWGVATVNFSYNVWRPGGNGSTNTACGSTDTLASTPPAFVNEVNPPGTGIDLHLVSASTLANNFVPSPVCDDYVLVDFDNDPRPQGAACDAGADEYLSGYTPPPTGGTGTTGGGSTTPPKTKLPGDCNADGHVSVIDLSILLSHYGTNYASADFDSNHTVNVIDLSMLLSNYGR